MPMDVGLSIEKIPALCVALRDPASLAYLDEQAKQWAMGQDQTGEAITLNGHGYTPYTMDLKSKYGVGLGAVTDHVTLFQTGELYRTLRLDIENGNVIVSSPVPYEPELFARTGDVSGLQPANLEDYTHGPLINNMKPKITAVVKLDFV